MHLAIVDDHAMVREGLGGLIETSFNNEIETLALAECPEQLIKKFTEQHFDVILLDYHIPNTTPKENFSKLINHFDETKILFMSSDERLNNIKETINYGAHGYVVKSSDIMTLINSIKHVLNGGIHIPTNVLDSISNDRRDVYKALSKKQTKVFELLLEGLSNKEIAKQIHVTENTIKTHIAHIFKILNIKNRKEAIAKHK